MFAITSSEFLRLGIEWIVVIAILLCAVGFAISVIRFFFE